MKLATALIALLLASGTASAQQYASADGFRVCPDAQTDKGLSVVEEACGHISAPSFGQASFGSLAELRAARDRRDAFQAEADAYSACVTRFINSYRRPGADANSKAPDQAACAHAWAQDRRTKTVRNFGMACVAFSDRSMRDASIDPWSGSCFPTVGSERG